MKIKVSDIKRSFENRAHDNEWAKMKRQFIDSGINKITEDTLEDKMDCLTFHILYNKIDKLTDEEVYNHLVEEL